MAERNNSTDNLVKSKQQTDKQTDEDETEGSSQPKAPNTQNTETLQQPDDQPDDKPDDQPDETTIQPTNNPVEETSLGDPGSKNELGTVEKRKPVTVFGNVSTTQGNLQQIMVQDLQSTSTVAMASSSSQQIREDASLNIKAGDVPQGSLGSDLDPVEAIPDSRREQVDLNSTEDTNVQQHRNPQEEALQDLRLEPDVPDIHELPQLAEESAEEPCDPGPLALPGEPESHNGTITVEQAAESVSPVQETVVCLRF